MVGCGLIGASIGLALRSRGWHVTGVDRDQERVAKALGVGAIDAVGVDPDAVVTFVAVPVGMVAGMATAALAAGPGLVTDVGSVKRAIVEAVADRRFVGGHPMAGSEQEGVEGADAALFEGATWVLTPTEATDPLAYTGVRSVVTSLGADVVAVAPDRHDDLVALVSHVPHLTAAALMDLAVDSVSGTPPDGAGHAILLRLAAGGFRDMTRIAAGHPGIWPDICEQNQEAILATLDRLIAALGGLRSTVAGADRHALLGALARARSARVNLPARAATRPDTLVELRVPIPDRPGVLAEITTLAGELGVNIYDLEIAHSAEGPRGVLLLVVDAGYADLVRRALLALGYRPSVQRLS